MSAPRRRWTLAAVLAVAAVAMSACAPTPAPRPEPTRSAEVDQGIVYRSVDGADLLMDACLPAGEQDELRAVVLVHGGAFEAGDRTTMGNVCRLLAQYGLAAFAVDYRLLPSTYPAQVEDVAAAVTWLREPEQIERFGLDGDVSLLGSSAGAIIGLSSAARLAADGAPVTSVVGLSAAGDFTPAGEALGAPDSDLEDVVLGYLGCPSVEDCPIAAEASPLTSAASLPRTLLVHGSDELIPLQQAEALEEAMAEAGVDVTLMIVDGDNHGLQLLNARARAVIAEFLFIDTGQ